VTWVPESCALPTVEQPLRVAEFDQLFADALLGVERAAPTVLRLALEPAADQRARELAARESECCAFFSFTFDRGEGDRAVMEVAVPEAHRAVLDALAERARSALRARAAGMSAHSLRSGECAEQAGVNPQTLRYYERRGLLPRPERSLGGYRQYPPQAVTTLRAIKAAQQLGFTLERSPTCSRRPGAAGAGFPGGRARSSPRSISTSRNWPPVVRLLLPRSRRAATTSPRAPRNPRARCRSRAEPRDTAPPSRQPYRVGVTGVTVVRSVALLLLAADLEIGGAWMVQRADLLRSGRSAGCCERRARPVTSWPG